MRAIRDNATKSNGRAASDWAQTEAVNSVVRHANFHNVTSLTLPQRTAGTGGADKIGF